MSMPEFTHMASAPTMASIEGSDAGPDGFALAGTALTPTAESPAEVHSEPEGTRRSTTPSETAPYYEDLDVLPTSGQAHVRSETRGEAVMTSPQRMFSPSSPEAEPEHIDSRNHVQTEKQEDVGHTSAAAPKTSAELLALLTKRLSATQCLLDGAEALMN
jgi:hypothetical protein